MTAVAKPNQGEGDDMKTDEQLSPRECISALMDGELSGDDWAAAVALTQDDDEALADWQLYHLVGDVLRSSDLAAGRHDNAFVTRLSARLQAEAPAALQPQAAAPAVVALPQQPFVQPAANDGVFRWKMVAGLASVVAVAAVGWQMWGIAQPADTGAWTQASAPQTTPVMLRDARLDELMAAHRQFGGGTVLQTPNGFLRNATFETAAR